MSATWLSVERPKEPHSDPAGVREANGLNEGAHLSPYREAQ